MVKITKQSEVHKSETRESLLVTVVRWCRRAPAGYKSILGSHSFRFSSIIELNEW